MRGGHSKKVIIFYTFVSGSFTRFLSDIFKMQLTPLQCDWHLCAFPSSVLLTCPGDWAVIM